MKDLYYKETTKTASSLRTFPLQPQIAAYLQALKIAQDTRQKETSYNHTWNDFVCVKPNGDIISPEYVSKRFPKLCEACGLKRLKLHELRHSNISYLLNQGASMKEAQEWAGHSSYSTTANIYSHIQAKSKEKMAASLEKLLG